MIYECRSKETFCVSEDVSVTWDIQGKPVVRKGKQYMEITNFQVHLEPKSMKIQLDNMFNGNKELGQ